MRCEQAQSANSFGGTLLNTTRASNRAKPSDFKAKIDYLDKQPGRVVESVLAAPQLARPKGSKHAAAAILPKRQYSQPQPQT